MNRRLTAAAASRYGLVATTLCLATAAGGAEPTAPPPNIVLFYADDLGYGDLGCYNPRSKIPTPVLDRLAAEGLRFTDGHSSSSICSPSRYALLTGCYHWRKFHHIVDAFGPSHFAPERLTLPEMLRQRGYQTACIGKWHLGWDWEALKRADARPERILEQGRERLVWGHEDFDWSLPVQNGPCDHGFDDYFGDDVINFPPYAWIENKRLIEPPDGPLKLAGNPQEGAWEARPGPARSTWNFSENLPTLTRKAVDYVARRQHQNRPFFLYFPLPSPHAPIVPAREFDGRSQAGPYGDYAVQTDWACGQVLAALEAAGHAERTLVIFTADNGPERYAYRREVQFGHWSAEPLRGLKRDLYEGGHRVPFLLRWPGRLAPATQCDALVSQIDVMATLAAVVGYELPSDAAEDSVNLLPLLQGSGRGRTTLVHNTYSEKYALREDSWVLIDAEDGYHSPRDADWDRLRGYGDDGSPARQLFDLATDIGERRNVIDQHPQRAARMRETLAALRAHRGSTPPLSASQTP